MDNFYNSVGLACFLKSRRTDVLGTLNRRRLETPSNIKNLNERKMQRDVKLVTMISTFHKNDTAPSHRAGDECEKPVVVHNYNKNMGGVFLKDHKLSAYLMERKRCLKWYIKDFRRLLNCSILNSYIIYRCHDREKNWITGNFGML
ncbi:hypothetical protein K1T71_011618 [Dendrolimus kikuchii]|uniref:Uncharacterized protein n=1 Tax=Dendrolimus kikuchii TaxID=765133 RepID=A0ACC1CM17_9NEOP|nr:hypothetical protein K1T71_011618 [Dendrolimus kikuchii]